MIFTARELAECQDTLGRICDFVLGARGLADSGQDFYLAMAARELVRQVEGEALREGRAIAVHSPAPELPQERFA